MALVGQEPVLFSCCFRDNIAYGLDKWSEADVISAARQANAHDFIRAMPKGYDTLAGEKGLQVSGTFAFVSLSFFLFLICVCVSE